MVKERTGTLQEYDSAGRGSSQWLPTPLTADYLAPSTFKTAAQGSTGYGDTYPYIQPLYEASPLDRPLQQYGAGAAWRSASRSVRTEYLLNTASGVQSCKLYNTSGTSTGNYVAGTLHVVKTTDEDNHVAYTFTDKQGHTVLERRVNGSEYLDTYSVYDDFGNLVLVLQPEYQTTADLSLYAFRYEYDHRNLCVKKTLPGAGYISYTYNEGEQMTFSQDGNQRDNGKYTYYLYDKYGRMTEQGECTSTAYANKVVHILNHYDDYSFIGTTGFTNAFYTSGDTNGKGSLTGQTVTVFGSDDKVYIAHYYDIKGRVTKKVQSNLLGGYDVTTTTYTFTGNPATVTHEHTASGKTARTEVYTYTYDHADRLSTVKHKLGSGTEVTLASYTYDNKGRMATKKLHGSSTNTLTYSYNIRNWLTGISSGKFTQTLGYGSDYNGNISSMNWNANGASHAYTFTYDGVNRMLNATHGTGAYTEKVTSYDKNGNIKALQRYGNGLIDDLTYTYSGNQITRVDDATGNAAGFSNGASTTNEYVYDNNGNLTKDSNKGITNIAYNSLSLPSTVTFSDGSTIVYSYAADGTKLRTVHTISGTTTQKDYCANVVYENGIQKMLLTEEGYVDLSNSTYYYYLKDHQGNNRVVLSSGGTAVEVNHYYPFGGVFASTSNVQPYKYNGKELDTKKGLNWYDYGARHYDATLGRWLVVDPLAEKYYTLSPYIYCNNSPIRYIDPTGEGLKEAWETLKRATTVNFSVGLQAGLKIGSLGISANAGSFQMSNKDESKITTGVSLGLGIVDVGVFDNVYENDNNMIVKESGWSMRIPYVAEEKDFQLEYYNQARQKISTEKFNKKELSTDYDASMSFIIGLDFSVNWDELKTIINDFLK
ncbi:MAG: RHS repeat-associated core domain-containing protein [Bacteroidaceae bacterium]|nr:RHS repeat-associated core domain-containing protein [Bacteroidaceae bacterium]